MAKRKPDFQTWSEAAEGSLGYASKLIQLAKSDGPEQDAERVYCAILREADQLFPDNNAKADRDHLRMIATRACPTKDPRYSTDEWIVGSAHEWSQYLIHKLLGTIRKGAGLCSLVPGWEMLSKIDGEWLIAIRTDDKIGRPMGFSIPDEPITSEDAKKLLSKRAKHSPYCNPGFRRMWGEIAVELKGFSDFDFRSVISAVKLERANAGKAVPKTSELKKSDSEPTGHEKPTQPTKKTGKKAGSIQIISEVPQLLLDFSKWLKRNKNERHNLAKSRRRFLLKRRNYSDSELKKAEQNLKQKVLNWSKKVELFHR